MENRTLTLEEVHGYFVQEYIPIIFVFSLTSVIGIVGNIVTIVFYNNLSACSTNTLIITLAWMDLFVCVTSLGLVVEIYFNVLFTNQILCSTLHVLLYWATYSSTMTLWVISIDRHSKLCRPMKNQLSIKKAKMVVVVYFSIAALLSVRKAFTYKIVKIPLKIQGQELSGYSCTNSPDQNLGTIVWAFRIIEGGIFTVTFLTLVITYSRILRALIGHRKMLRHVAIKPSDNEKTRDEKSKFKNKRKRPDNDDSTHTYDSTQHTVVENENGRQNKQIQKNGSSSKSERKVVECINADQLDHCVTEPNKRVIETDSLVSQETDDSISIETSTSSLNSSVEKVNGVQNSEVHAHKPETVDEAPRDPIHAHKPETVDEAPRDPVHAHKPETVDEAPRDPQVNSTNNSQTSTSDKITKLDQNMKTSVNNIKRSERRVTFMMLAVSVAFLLCFLPYFVMRSTQGKWQYFNEKDFSVELWLPFLIPVVNSVINPILYCVLNQRYRRFVKGCVRKMLCC